MRQLVPPGALFTRLVAFAVCAEICLGANVLSFIGVPYVTNGGSILLKLHPGTDLLLCLSITLLFIRDGHAQRSIDPQILIFLTAMFCTVLCVFVSTGPDNLIVLLDTFLPAGLFAALSPQISAKGVLLLRHAMQWAFSVNAAVALSEVICRQNFIPLYTDDEIYRPHYEDFRPTAFYDHPLTGSLMTMMALALAPSSGSGRVIYQALMWMTLFAFGGRVAIGVSLLTLFYSRGAEIVRQIVSRDPRANKHSVQIIVKLTVGLCGIAALSFTDLSDRLMGHLYWDPSAQVRLAQWNILGSLDGRQLLFGASRHEILERINVLRLASGTGVIENCWLLLFISLGSCTFLIFMSGISSLFVWCWRISERLGKVLMLSVLVVASSSNSLGRKSTVLVCLMASLVCIGRAETVKIRTRGARGMLWRMKAA